MPTSLVPTHLDDAAHWREHYARAAASWSRWADPLAAQQEKVNALLLDAAGVGPGMRVLDLASGAGEPALSCAARVGPRGRVVATDAVPAMIDGLRARAARRGLDTIDCQVAAMEHLPFEDASFDAVTCRYGLMYVDDPVQALREALRVLRPGGRVALMAWGPEADNTVVWPIFRALQSVVPERLAEAEVIRPLRFAAEGALRAPIAGAGFAEVREEAVRLEPRLKRGVPFWIPLLEMNAGEVWGPLDAARRAAVERAHATSIERYADADGWRLSTCFRIASGVRP
jgi:ubiquinone/menaquinone biosynthesis C-methylase UbiE